MRDFKDKIVIISGGSRGIGRACCLAFAKAGATVVFTYNHSTKDAEQLQDEIKSCSSEGLGLQSDVKDLAKCKEVVAKTVEKFGRIDILVNNAGIIRDKTLLMMEAEDWHEVIDTNLTGVFNMTRAAIYTLLKQKHGTIINMSSVSGIAGIAGQTNYSAAKAGIIGFTKALAKETAGYNIRVNAIAPGFIETDMISGIKETTKQEILKNLPMKKFGEVDDVAEACLFLASEKSKYITGEVLKIAGGMGI